ncbi:MAG: hydrogenobyrinic acid a,c-diamide synthase (glutamine-hydrolyzing) [Syntrophomonadaceae bacterium]|jgi:cobyrinic acid a,c-diamide synthase|nr:hydrogenobyrinic acid a,c-diamide synthase (glutamine-hydrolyzing) [Syntrophomonadaceae bacterium]
MRLVVAAPHGRSGKSTITLGMIGALQDKKRIKVQPFKKGPDFIDPSWLTWMAGRPCRNLDLFFSEPGHIQDLFDSACTGADMAIVEGAMGLYDGVDVEGSDSTAAIARIIKAPVILVVDSTRMTRSAAALVKGFQDFEAGVTIAGVILNKVARPRHENILRQSIEKYTGIPVIGAVPKQNNILIADRHLGLVTAQEANGLEELKACLTDAAAKYIDLDALIRIAENSPGLPLQYRDRAAAVPARVRIGVIKDKVFSFYYPENLEALRDSGAELVMVDSLLDKKLPEVDALYIGGGFPEIYAEELQENYSLRSDLRRLINTGLPVYAECGGLMYLSRQLFNGDQSYEMVGALPCDTKMYNRPKGHGYSKMKVIRSNYLFPENEVIRGHEFHHSQICNVDTNSLTSIMEVQRGYGFDGKKDGIIYHNVIAVYQHIYAPANPDWAVNFTAKAINFKEQMRRISG